MSVVGLTLHDVCCWYYYYLIHIH